MHWGLQPVKFEFEIVHSAGIKPPAADVLSTLPTNGSDPAMLEDDIHVMGVTRSNKQALNSQSIDTADGSQAKMNSNIASDPLTLPENSVAP